MFPTFQGREASGAETLTTCPDIIYPKCQRQSGLKVRAERASAGQALSLVLLTYP